MQEYWNTGRIDWKQNKPDEEDASGVCANEANLINRLCEELIDFSLTEKL